MARPPHNLAGKTYGHWTATSKRDSVPTRGNTHRPRWLCRCVCGEKQWIRADALRSAHYPACPRCSRARPHRKPPKFGPERGVWLRMLTLAAAKGLPVSDRWRKYEAFLADVGPRPSPKHRFFRRNLTRGFTRANTYWSLGQPFGRGMPPRI